MATIKKNEYKFNIEQNVFIDFNDVWYTNFDDSTENLILYNDDLEETLYFFLDVVTSMEEQQSINTINRLIQEYNSVKEKLCR